jgi:hypothetical protein
MKALYLLAPVALFCGAVLAEAPAELPPPPMSDDEEIEPEVQIIKRDDKTIEEFRVNGRLYMIKVTPKNAPPYFLIDTDGDGAMEAQRSEIEPDLMIPHWVLFRW